MPRTSRNIKVNDVRKAFTDPTPLYFAAGVIDKIREVAPERLAAVKATDPKVVQERFAHQAKQTQSRLSAALSELDTDIKKLREQAQHLALQGVGIAAEYAVKAREGYGEMADRGRGAMRTWRGGRAGNGGSGATADEREEEYPVFKPEAEPAAGKQQENDADTGGQVAAGAAGKAAGAGERAAARKATARRSTAKKATSGKPTPKSVARATSRAASKTAQPKDQSQS